MEILIMSFKEDKIRKIVEDRYPYESAEWRKGFTKARIADMYEAIENAPEHTCKEEHEPVEVKVKEPIKRKPKTKPKVKDEVKAESKIEIKDEVKADFFNEG